MQLPVLVPWSEGIPPVPQQKIQETTMARTAVWDSSSNSDTNTVAKNNPNSCRPPAKRCTKENIDNEASMVQCSSRTTKQLEQLGGPETTAITRKKRGQPSLKGATKVTGQEAAQQITQKQVMTLQDHKAHPITQDDECTIRNNSLSMHTKLLTPREEDEARPTSGHTPTQSREEDEARPTGGPDSTTSGEEDEAHPTSGRISTQSSRRISTKTWSLAALPTWLKSREKDEAYPTGGLISTQSSRCISTKTQSLAALPTRLKSGEKDEAYPTGGPISTQSGRCISTKTRSLAALPTWLESREKDKAYPTGGPISTQTQSLATLLT